MSQTRTIDVAIRICLISLSCADEDSRAPAPPNNPIAHYQNPTLWCSGNLETSSLLHEFTILRQHHRPLRIRKPHLFYQLRLGAPHRSCPNQIIKRDQLLLQDLYRESPEDFLLNSAVRAIRQSRTADALSDMLCAFQGVLPALLGRKSKMWLRVGMYFYHYALQRATN